MNNYEEKALHELLIWQKKMIRKPSITNRLAKGLQNKINNKIPEKVHDVITNTIKNMVKAVLTGSEFISGQPVGQCKSFEERERLVLDKANFYKKAAATTGAGTGVGGILLGLADFPILISLKIKFLFEVATLYGFDVRDYRERIYILHIFELAFSSQERRIELYNYIVKWQQNIEQLPRDLSSFDWRKFQQEYRDYIDLVKMMQLVPVIGAFVGAYANYGLMDKLRETAMNSYRLRILK